ncbi:unnamed protein product [Urochloa humidicola]
MMIKSIKMEVLLLLLTTLSMMTILWNRKKISIALSLGEQSCSTPWCLLFGTSAAYYDKCLLPTPNDYCRLLQMCFCSVLVHLELELNIM